MNLKNVTAIALATMALTACDTTTGDVGFSLTDEADRLVISDGVYDVYSQSYVPGAVTTRNNECVVGKVKDPETGTYVKGDMMAQFVPLRDYSLPELDMVTSLDDNNQVMADSCYIGLFYTSTYGDTLAPMKVTAYELTRPLEEGNTYKSDFDVFANGYASKDNYQASRSYTLDNPNNMIKIPLNKPYAKDGVTYNNYGSYLLRQYYEHGENFETFYQFLHNVCPGFFIENNSGLSNMANVFVSELYVYFRYKEVLKDKYGNDSIANHVGYTRIDGTEEVLQINKVTNDQERIAELAQDESCTYVKTPAGIFTELTLPVDEIMDGHEKDSLNTAKMVLQCINNHNNDYNFDIPSTLLILQKDSLDKFFDENQLVNYQRSFLAYYNKNTEGSDYNAYTFNNIAGLITEMHKNKGKSENWNKAIVVPVRLYTTSSNYGSGTTITKITHDMSLSSAKLMKGTTDNPIKLTVVYSRFNQ